MGAESPEDVVEKTVVPDEVAPSQEADAATAEVALEEVALEEEREATILLQVDDVVINEVKGRERTQLDKGDMTVLKIAATEAELSELGCQVATDFSADAKEVVFVIIGEHKLPIIKNVPVIRKEPHKYTFLMPGLFLEAVMPDDVDPEEIEVLELVLQQNGVFRVKGQPVPSATVTVGQDGDRASPRGTVGDRVSGGIQMVSDKVVGGINTATPVVQGGINKGATFAVDRITPNEQPAQINTRGLREARLASKTAVIVSGQMANAMVGLAKQLGGKMGAVAQDTPAGRTVNSGKSTEVKKVAASSAVAVVNVIEAATDAMKAVLTTSCDGLSDVVGHKYGEDAGVQCKEGLGVVQDVVATGLNLRMVGVKGLAKAAGKQAAKDFVSTPDEPAPAAAEASTAAPPAAEPSV